MSEPVKIYLDQAKWIDLLFAATGHSRGERYVDALAAVRDAVASGTASFPLDMFRYYETSKRRKDKSRVELADLMFDISRQHTMAHPTQILPMEIDEALHRQFGRPKNPRQVEVFGVGVEHVTAGKVAPPTFDLSALPSNTRITSEAQKAELQRHLQDFAARLLARSGPDDARRVGFDPFAAHFGADYVAHENKIADTLRRHGLAGDRLDTMVRASDLGDIRPAVTEALSRIGMTWDGFIASDSESFVRSFMDDLPTRHVTNVMRAAKFKSGQKWEPNDLNDILGLPVGAVYCDVVVTEKQWVHHLRLGGIEKRYGTELLSDTAKLVDVLGRIS